MSVLLPPWVHAERARTREATLYVTDAMEKHAARAPLRWVKAVRRGAASHH